MIVALVCGVVAGTVIWAALLRSQPLLMIVAFPLIVVGAMCVASAFGILTRKRRLATQEERDAYRAQHGSLD